MPTNRKTSLNPQTKSDTELVELVKNDGDDESFQEICRRYENIFYKMCQKYVKPLSLVGIDPKDIFEEKHNLILNSVSSYDKNRKTKLGTWIGNNARWLCLNSINKRKLISHIPDPDLQQRVEETQVTHDYLNNHENSKEDYAYILNLLNQLKDPRIIDIFKYRYFGTKRMIWAQIAKKMKISTQTAINLHNKGIELIKRKVNSENISDVL